jgi:alpha-mannosidase
LCGSEAAELLSAWTSLWHPSLIDATGSLPGWHSTETPPEPDTLDGELILVPSISRERLPADWQERIRAASPNNLPPLNALASREATVAAALAAASLAADCVNPSLAGEFLALAYAHLQVELLTRAMRYTTVLDADEFRTAVIAAARAAVTGDDARARDSLAQAFDLLMDARNHFYSVDFYLVDVTLLADSTLGEPLRQKLATGPPTNLLGSSELAEQLAHEHPDTFAELKQAIDAGRACLTAGPLRGSNLAHRAPEGILTELIAARDVYRRLLERDPEVFAQFGASYSPLLPQALGGLGYRAALFAAFDGNRSERPPQPKSRWGEPGGPSIDILAAIPLDVAKPGTWLSLGERIGDTLVRDHVATILLAGWPGQASEYSDDLRRIAAYGPVLGKFVTLEEYFRLTAEVEDWATFHPHSYPMPSATDSRADKPISSRVDTYRRHVVETFDRLSVGLAAIVPSVGLASTAEAVLNPWNFACPRFVGFDPVNFALPSSQSETNFLPNVPGCGYATPAAAADSPVPLADGRTLHNELIEVVVSETTGGIQSFRSHRDRNTRVSQRLVMHDRRLPQGPLDASMDSEGPRLETQMIADRIETTLNGRLAGEIAAQGRLVDADDRLLARFVQSMRVVRGLPVVIVNVQLALEMQPEGDVWSSYFASRLAWREEAATLRHGVDWTARETGRSRIDSSEWVEIADATGSIGCFGFGLPYHRLAEPTWLDTLLAVAGDSPARVQFAVGLSCGNPVQMALALLTAGRPAITKIPSPAAEPQGWFLHVSAKHVIVTHLEPLPAANGGLRLRLLETEGRAVRTSLTAFRPFIAARQTDFRGGPTETLPVAEGRVQFEIGPFGWLQIEAEW